MLETQLPESNIAPWGDDGWMVKVWVSWPNAQLVEQWGETHGLPRSACDIRSTVRSRLGVGFGVQFHNHADAIQFYLAFK